VNLVHVVAAVEFIDTASVEPPGETDALTADEVVVELGRVAELSEPGRAAPCGRHSDLASVKLSAGSAATVDARVTPPMAAATRDNPAQRSDGSVENSQSCDARTEIAAAHARSPASR